MAWFQMKYGIAIVYLGLLTCALDYGQTKQWAVPISFGTVIVAAAYLAQGLKRWYYLPLQCNTLMFLGLVFLAGNDLGQGLTPASIFCGLGLLIVCSHHIFIASESFQQERRD